MIRKSAKRFSEISCSNKGLKRDDDSTKSHRAIETPMAKPTDRQAEATNRSDRARYRSFSLRIRYAPVGDTTRRKNLRVRSY